MAGQEMEVSHLQLADDNDIIILHNASFEQLKNLRALSICIEIAPKLQLKNCRNGWH